MLTTPQQKALQLLANTLEKNNIVFQATGGLAAIAYGAPRPLYDIDIDIYKKDVEVVRQLFHVYVIEDWNNDLEGEADQFDIYMMTLDVEGVPVDISQIEGCRVRALGGEWVAQPEVMEVEMMSVDGIMIPIQNKQHLISYKKILARDTDIEDIAQLEK